MSFLWKYYTSNFKNEIFTSDLKNEENKPFFTFFSKIGDIEGNTYIIDYNGKEYNLYNNIFYTGLKKEKELLKEELLPINGKKTFLEKQNQIIEKEIINLKKKERDLQEELSKLNKLELMDVTFDRLDRFIFQTNYTNLKDLLLYFEELKTRYLFFYNRIYSFYRVEDFLEKYDNSFRDMDTTVIVKIKNNVNNSFACLQYDDFILHHTTIGTLNKNYKEEKYGNWLLSKKIQRYLIIYKWMVKDLLTHVVVECHGIKRYFRASLGHLTQYIVRITVRFKKMVRRYVGWLLKFARIGLRIRKIPKLTKRQKRHTFFLYWQIQIAIKKLLVWTQLRLLKSYAHSRYKVRKRKSKYSFGY